ncbi:ABC transporter ATP-binding protein [Actinomyces bowdenii]|uniref:ABC transporter ATP-binding protein n=1 Tax=Actinomyces bowdenii TaxID=131109 RepID=UPI00214AB1CC|nr:ABC transporter ATP-binding protein [Actinomyces bowdenii]MCR2052325.1 ABC transporter ATP-binding protein [Actinomyces bowdenii]
MSKSLSGLAIRAEGMVKTFGSTRALDGLTLRVRTGEVHGFLGPNGAGKTTTIRALLGQLRLEGGSAEVLGMPAWQRAVDIHERLAYVPGDTALWPGLSGGECIDLLAGLHGPVSPSRREELIERFELDPSRRIRTYSKGNRQKVALIAALATPCELLVLDEPTSGLDPVMEAVFQQVVAERSAQGATVLLSSHILAEVETLCARVTVVRAGRAVSTGSLAQLRARAPVSIEALTATAPQGLDRLEGVSRLRQGPAPRGVETSLLVTRTGLAEAVAALSAAGPLDLAVRPPSLEQLFLEHYRDDGAAGPPPSGADDAPEPVPARIDGGGEPQ